MHIGQFAYTMQVALSTFNKTCIIMRHKKYATIRVVIAVRVTFWALSAVAWAHSKRSRKFEFLRPFVHKYHEYLSVIAETAVLQFPHNRNKAKIVHKYNRNTTAKTFHGCFSVLCFISNVQRLFYFMFFFQFQLCGHYSLKTLLCLQAQKEFRTAMKEEGLELTKEMGADKKHRYLLVHTPFWRLCVEAERVGLKMPLKNVRSFHSCDTLSKPVTTCVAHMETPGLA